LFADNISECSVHAHSAFAIQVDRAGWKAISKPSTISSALTASCCCQRGQVLFSQRYGLANQVFGDPNTADTRLFIGSITKRFTAAAIVALQDDGKLNIDDRITFRNLLTRTSGIPGYTDDPEAILTGGITLRGSRT
jgi:hypothetical protein